MTNRSSVRLRRPIAALLVACVSAALVPIHSLAAAEEEEAGGGACGNGWDYKWVDGSEVWHIGHSGIGWHDLIYGLQIVRTVTANKREAVIKEQSHFMGDNSPVHGSCE